MIVPPAPRLEPRRIGVLVWVALLVLLLLFLGLVLAVSPPAHYAAFPRPFLLGIGVVLSALALVLSRLLPSRIGAGPGPVAPRSAAVALVRLLVVFLPSQGAALFLLGAYLAVRDGWLLAVFAVDALYFLSLFPTERRFAALALAESPGERPARLAKGAGP
ncbi:MAG TPA: hypothetical protein VMG32_07555 [Anaeromyxobacteraceae bacterium]|nr:hypothetical protein [Anaeromyxobacteraceae bacterium]